MRSRWKLARGRPPVSFLLDRVKRQFAPVFTADLRARLIACDLVKRGCVPLSRPVGVWLDKLYRQGVKGRLWPREALISRCLAPRRGLPVQQRGWIRPAAGTPSIAPSRVAGPVRWFYISHKFAALAQGYEVVKGERPAVCGRQVHVDSATAQPAHGKGGVAL